MVALAALGAAGHGGYASDPVGAVALAAAATVSIVVAARLGRSGHRTAVPLAQFGRAVVIVDYLLQVALLQVALVAAIGWYGLRAATDREARDTAPPAADDRSTAAPHTDPAVA